MAYLLTALVGAVAFSLYVPRPAWPYLALGIAATTMAVPEALADWTGGSLGAAGVLLVAGITLIAASLAASWLRRGVLPPTETLSPPGSGRRRPAPGARRAP